MADSMGSRVQANGSATPIKEIDIPWLTAGWDATAKPSR